MNEIKDWRGTPIEVGSPVVYHYEWKKGLGKVVEFVAYQGWCGRTRQKLVLEWSEHSSHDNKRSKPIDPDNVTVLTKDMFDDAN